MVACLAVGPVRGPARGPARGAQRLRLLLVACLAWGLAPRQSAPMLAPVRESVLAPVRGPVRGPTRGPQQLRLLLVACLAWGLAPQQSAPRQSAPVLAPVLAKVPQRRPTVAAGLVLGPVQK